MNPLSPSSNNYVKVKTWVESSTWSKLGLQLIYKIEFNIPGRIWVQSYDLSKWHLNIQRNSKHINVAHIPCMRVSSEGIYLWVYQFWPLYSENKETVTDTNSTKLYKIKRPPQNNDHIKNIKNHFISSWKQFCFRHSYPCFLLSGLSGQVYICIY